MSITNPLWQCIKHFSCSISYNMRGYHGLHSVHVRSSHSMCQEWDPLPPLIFQDSRICLEQVPIVFWSTLWKAIFSYALVRCEEVIGAVRCEKGICGLLPQAPTRQFQSSDFLLHTLSFSRGSWVHYVDGSSYLMFREADLYPLCSTQRNLRCSVRVLIGPSDVVPWEDTFHVNCWLRISRSAHSSLVT